MRLDSASRAYCKCRAWVYKLAHMTTAYDVGEIPPIGVHHRLRIAREWANLEQSELSERTGIAHFDQRGGEGQDQAAQDHTQCVGAGYWRSGELARGRERKNAAARSQ